MLFERVAIVAKTLPVDDKIPACVKQNNISWVLRKVSRIQTLSFETLCFLEKRLLSLFKFCASNNLLFFMSC